MIPYQHVLVALDFGPSTARVLEHAVNAAGSAGVVHLVHVIEWVPTMLEGALAGYGSAAQMRPLMEAARHKLTELAARSGAARTTTDVVQGNPALSVLEVAERREADLLVIGTHGRSRAARLLLGHVMERVLRGAQCPVLVVR